MRLRFVVLAAVVTGLSVPPAARADTTIATLDGPTPVRSFAGTAILSLRDGPDGPYRLAVVRGNAAPRVLPGVAPSRTPFDADIGPGPGGAPVIVFRRCPAAPGRCHLWRTTPTGGGERLIAGAASTGGSESAPTVWGHRLAFARSYGQGSEQVYVRDLDAPGSVRSTRLPGVPSRVCEDGAACRAITDGRVPELELRGTRLAQSVRYGLRRAGICGAAEVRLVDVASRRARRLVHTICGLSGQTYVGLSQTSRAVVVARICPGDPGGCDNHEARAERYVLASGVAQRAPVHALLAGFAAVADDRALVVRVPLERDQPVMLVSERLAWEPLSAR